MDHSAIEHVADLQNRGQDGPRIDGYRSDVASYRYRIRLPPTGDGIQLGPECLEREDWRERGIAMG